MDAKIDFGDYDTGSTEGPGDVTVKVMTPRSSGGGGVSVTSLGQLSDVDLGTLRNKQVLKYNSSTHMWENAAEDLPNLGDLGNVQLTSPTNDQVLKYDSATNKWINADGSGSTPANLNSLSDVTVLNPTNKQTLKFNQTTNKFENSSLSLNDLSNVSVSSPTAGQVLKYNSLTGKFENSAEAAGISTLAGLSDTDVGNASNNQILRYNNTTHKWENSAENVGATALTGLSDVDIDNPIGGQVLKYNATTGKFENANESGGGGGASALDDLTDVDISTPTAGQVLIFDDTSDTWVNGDAGNSSEQVISMADYLALTDAEKNNGTSYYIYDAVNEGREIQPVIYSLEEREIGVWTDGKPLYQKTYYYDNQTTIGDGYTAIATLSGVDRIVSLTGNIVDTSSNNNSYSLPYAFNNKTTSLYYDNNDIGIRVNNDTWGPDWDIVVTIQYTKTTDTAGSGIWTTMGVPAVHYDGNEKVIGTWFGETLYEKSIVSTSSLSSGTTNYIPLGITNIDKIVSIEGFVAYGSHKRFIPLPYGDSGNSNVRINAVATDDSTVNIYVGNDYSGSSAIDLTLITIRYTKSSS